MMRHYFLLVLILASGSLIRLQAQKPDTAREGTVSYITGKNIYVRFESTQGIENGDTLFVLLNALPEPALIVQHRSSVSCLCNAIGEKEFKVSDKVFARIINPVISEPRQFRPEGKVEKDVSEEVLTSGEKEIPVPQREQNIYGRMSVSSYSNFSNSASADYHRLRYTFSMNASRISGSRISAETYISFSHLLNQWDLVKENLYNALKIYSLALNYRFGESASLWAGRKINPKIANAGAIDGLQFEYTLKNYFAGVVAGSRPDYRDYSFNFNLPEYGAYVGHNHKFVNGFLQSSLAFFEQRNGSHTDRRFIYFQHSNSAVKHMNIFSSVELDLYKTVNGQPKNSLSLTSLYLSLSYRFFKRLSLFGSYDNRRNVIYYETFKNYSDAILQQASRQGFRVRLNYNPVNYLNLGINAGTRFQKNDPRSTNTLNGYTTYSRVPGINASMTISANLLQTAYLDGQIYSANFSKDLVPGKLSCLFQYRFVRFTYLNSISDLIQNIGEIDFSWQVNKKLYLSANFEGTFQDNEVYNRLYLNLRKKF